MTAAEVIIAGRRLSRRGIVSGLQDSTIFRTEGWSGDYQASCALSLPRGASLPWLRRGALWQTYEAGRLTWAGFVDEVARDGNAFQVSAYGRGSRAAEFPALRIVGGVAATVTYIPNEGVDHAVPRGLGFDRAGVDLGSEPVAVAPDQPTTVGEVLDRRAAALGKRWWVDSYGRVTFRDVGSLKWTMRPGEEYLSSADDEYVSLLWGFFVSAIDASGEPSEWGFARPTTTGQEGAVLEKFGPREQVVDLTALGYLYSAAAARAQVDSRFARVGARMGWANGVELTETNMKRIGTRVANPLGVRAGDQLMLPGVVDHGSAGTYRPNVEITAAEVVRLHDERRAEVKPVGLAPRGYAEALANAQAPRETIISA